MANEPFGGDKKLPMKSALARYERRLIDANMRKDTEPLKFVRKMASELRDAWKQITKKSPNPDLEEMKKGGGIDIAG